jgi:hypothetical protein
MELHVEVENLKKTLWTCVGILIHPNFLYLVLYISTRCYNPTFSCMLVYSVEVSLKWPRKGSQH